MNYEDASIALRQSVDAVFPSGVRYENTHLDISRERIDVRVLWGVPERITIGGRHRVTGILQLGLAVPEEEGVSWIYDTIGTIVGAWPTDRRIAFSGGTARVTMLPSVEDAVEVDGVMRRPVSIYFEVLT